MKLAADKICLIEDAVTQIQEYQSKGLKVAFTNGCFDLLHPGHTLYLEQVRLLADLLVVGLNTDLSISRLKGDHRPIVGQWARAQVIAGLACVDLVVLFDQDTPLQLIEALKPDILAKGADYQTHQIVGADFVIANGGAVHTITLSEGFSTSAIINKIKNSLV